MALKFNYAFLTIDAIHKTTIAPITAKTKERKSKSFTVPHPKNEPIQPPTIAPTIPRIIVIIQPPLLMPGKINLANAPATSPKTIHKSIPIIQILIVNN